MSPVDNIRISYDNPALRALRSPATGQPVDVQERTRDLEGRLDERLTSQLEAIRSRLRTVPEAASASPSATVGPASADDRLVDILA